MESRRFIIINTIILFFLEWNLGEISQTYLHTLVFELLCSEPTQRETKEPMNNNIFCIFFLFIPRVFP